MIGWIAYAMAAALVALYFLERNERTKLKARLVALEVKAGTRWSP